MQRKMTGRWRVGFFAAALIAASIMPVGSSSADIGTQARPTFKSPFNCGKTFYANAWWYDPPSGKYHSPKYSVDWQSYGGDSINGETVRASYGGTARFYDKGGASYGKYVIVTHGSSGWKTRYAHLSSMVKSAGSSMTVSRGTKIGNVGQTGNANGPHLHYEQYTSSGVQTSVVEGKTLSLGSKKAVTSTNNCGGGSSRNGVCEAGEFCYYYNSNHQGSLSDHGGSLGDYGTTQPSCYEFKSAGNGQGRCIKNDAASAWNRSSKTVRVYYNSYYGGTYQTFAPGAKKNLSAALKNNNASHKFL